MTALTEYDRLEATALWRADGESQRREVIVSIGDATLVISDTAGQPLGHWSLPAVERINGTNEKTAIYSAASDSDERLELDDETMITAIARIGRALERGRSHPGRLRSVITGLAIGGVVALGVLWLPGALIRQATSIVPSVTRDAIGAQLLDRMVRLSGEPCADRHSADVLDKLNTRLRPAARGDIIVVQSGVPITQHLPGGRLLLNVALIEDYDNPNITAGFILAEDERAAQTDPLERLLSQSGFMATLRLLTTGQIDDTTLDAHTEQLVTAAPTGITSLDPLIARFVQAEVPLSPYAYALDITGASTLALIEADAVHITTTRDILDDGDWAGLQNICSSE